MKSLLAIGATVLSLSSGDEIDPVQEILEDILSRPPEKQEFQTNFSSIKEIRKISSIDERLDAYLEFFIARNSYLCGYTVMNYCKSMTIESLDKLRIENASGVAIYSENHIEILSTELKNFKRTEEIIAHEISHLLVGRGTIFSKTCDSDSAHERLAEYHGMYILVNAGWSFSELKRHYRNYRDKFKGTSEIHLSTYDMWHLSVAVVDEMKIKTKQGLGLIPKKHDFCNQYFWVN